MVANTYKTAWEGDCSPHAGRCVPGSCCPHSAEMLLLRSRRGPRDLPPRLAHGYRQNRSHLCLGFMQGRRPLVLLPAGVPGRQEKRTCVQRLLWRARSELLAAGARRRLQEQTACAPFSTTWWANTPPRCISKYDGSEQNKASCSIRV